MLGAVVLLMTALYGSIFMRLSENVLKEETLQIYQNMVEEESDTLSSVMNNLEYLVHTISNNTQVIDACSLELVDQQAIESILSDYMWNDAQTKYLDVITVVGINGMSYSTSPLSLSDEEEGFALWEENYLQRKQDSEQMCLVNTTYTQGYSIFKYTFQVMEAIEDHYTGQVVGYLVMDVSEYILYLSYRPSFNMEKNGIDLRIVDENNVMVSSGNKEDIGQVYTALGSYNIMESDIDGTSWKVLIEVPNQMIDVSFEVIRSEMLWVMILTLLVMVLAIWYFMNRIFVRVKTLKDGLNSMACGDMDVEIPVKSKDDFGEIYMAFNDMNHTIKEQMQLIKMKEQQKQLLELDFLRAQIKPHFVYNTLSSIRFYVEMGRNEDACDMLVSFSKLLRKTLVSSNHQIPIVEELEGVQEYVRLQAYRYPEAFSIDYDVDPDVMQHKMLSFILQPLVENAIFHGPKQETRCAIRLGICRKGAFIHVMVIDNGKGMDAERLEHILDKPIGINHIGMSNVNERLILHYGQQSGLRVESKEGEGTQISFLIPWGEEDDDAKDFNCR